jgi:hypothetical protein
VSEVMVLVDPLNNFEIQRFMGKQVSQECLNIE